MAKAAKVKVRVSTQPVVLMEAEVARKIRQHARSSMKAEVCGVLIGSTEHERMMVEACIAGNNAAQGGAHVTFTQDTWEHIYKVKDKEYPEQKIVGWYHSHPGFGVFLSEHDLFIQQNFFSNPQQVAWVYDPHTDEEGCFGWVGDKIEKLSGIRVGYSQAVEAGAAGRNDYEDEDAALDPIVKMKGSPGPQEPVWLRWVSTSMGYAAAVLLGFVLGFLFMNWEMAPALEKARRYDELVRMIRQSQEEQRQGAAPAAATGQAQPSLPSQEPPAAPQQQQAAPQPQKNLSPEKGNNGKH
jgi:proteasome lid subunit RPN8/RPN11